LTIENINEEFLVKTAGGAAAQCLGLINAIYVSNKIGKSFKISHYPYSTGTYFPLAIQELLDISEISNPAVSTKGLEIENELVKGSVIQEHPLLNQMFSYEMFLFLLRRVGIYNFIKSLKGELVIDFSKKRLEQISGNTKAISGGFIPIVDLNVMAELKNRFINSRLTSPFKTINDKSPEVVIHYRLGDKKLSRQYSNLGIDGVVDPLTFQNILAQEGLLKSRSIYVISDEPMIAQDLLKSVGIVAKVRDTNGDIWADISLMASAKVAICSWSQVSQLAAIFNIHNGGKVFYSDRSSTGFSPRWTIPGATAFKPKFLGSDHDLYSK
jgi:hypothetical protein